MRKKTKKCRKASRRPLGDVPCANKENSFSNIFCRKGDVQDFRTKPVETATRSCSVDKKRDEKTLKDESIQKKQQLCSSKNSKLLSFSSRKILSVSFFIPLNGYSHDYKNLPSGKIIDWNNLVLYKCNNAAMLSYFPNKQVKKMYYFKPTILPQLKLKCSKFSESFSDSEVHYIRIKNADEYEDNRECSSVKVKKKRGEKHGSFSSKTKKAQSEEKSLKKKVRFVDNSELATVHVIVAWNYAYRAARISQWEVVARDAERFKQKIKSLEPILSPILSSEHRAKIWKTRMCDEET